MYSCTKIKCSAVHHPVFDYNPYTRLYLSLSVFIVKWVDFSRACYRKYRFTTLDGYGIETVSQQDAND